jgi:fructokinase
LDVAGTGFTVLDRIYQDGELSDEALGGSCANVLVSLAMLDRHVAPVLRLGDDEEGERLIDEFTNAGAVVDFIHRSAGLRSPILTEQIDTASSHHDFSFRCPETDAVLPRYEPIGSPELEQAQFALSDCAVFYTDRLSPSILDAMHLAYKSGATIVFEPSAIEDEDVFLKALTMTTVLKSSMDRLNDDLESLVSKVMPQIRIITHGSKGLEIRDQSNSIWCNAIPAAKLRDACGSGDMVSVGLIDWMLGIPQYGTTYTVENLVEGVIAGQRLAAANCAYEGARGLFRNRGAAFARSVLSEVQHSLRW